MSDVTITISINGVPKIDWLIPREDFDGTFEEFSEEWGRPTFVCLGNALKEGESATEGEPRPMESYFDYSSEIGDTVTIPRPARCK